MGPYAVISPFSLWRPQVNLDSSAFLADPQLVLALDRKAIELSCGADRVLFRQGDSPVGLYILHKGEVTLTMDSPKGEVILSAEARAGSLLGLPGLIGNEPYTLTATAHSGAELGFVPREDFTALMQSDPYMSLKVLQVLAAEVRSARHAILQR
jgi:CRP-like cAMP-binding protein